MRDRPASNPGFVDLVDRLLERVYRYLRNLTRDEEESRALCHDTFVKLHEQLARGGEVGDAYVFAAARNTAYQQAEKVLLEEMPVIPLYFNVQNFLVSPAVKDWQADRLWTRFYRNVRLR